MNLEREEFGSVVRMFIRHETLQLNMGNRSDGLTRLRLKMRADSRDVF
jgi:hypothetical protein